LKNEILLLKLKVRTGIAKNEKKKEKEKREKRRGEESEPKLKPWCCYIVFQPQSLQICFKSNPINKIKSNLYKIR